MMVPGLIYALGVCLLVAACMIDRDSWRGRAESAMIAIGTAALVYGFVMSVAGVFA